MTYFTQIHLGIDLRTVPGTKLEKEWVAEAFMESGNSVGKRSRVGTLQRNMSIDVHFDYIGEF